MFAVESTVHRREGEEKVVENRVRELRLARGWSLEHLSDRTGISKSHLSSVERGLKSPTIYVARRIARAFQATLDTLFPEEVFAPNGRPARRV